MRPWVIGIDPGKTGAFVIYNYTTKKPVLIKDMPLLDQYVNVVKMEEELTPSNHLIHSVFLENPHSMPNDGHAGAFNFGYNCGLMKGLFAGLRIPVHLIEPATWKMIMGLSSNKDESRKMAMTRWPQCEDYFKRKKDDGRAEAALIAYFGVTKILGIK